MWTPRPSANMTGVISEERAGEGRMWWLGGAQWKGKGCFG
jgi:hypothetical protein